MVSVAQAKPVIGVDDETLSAMRLVEDKDGFTYVRAGASAKSKVVEKLNTGSVVMVEEMKGDWAKVSDDSGRNRPMFVHSSRLKSIKGWQQSKGKAEGKSGVARTGVLEVNVKAMVFVKDDHKITKDENGQALVDGRTIWGRDGGLPVAEISLTVRLDGKAVAVPGAATRNLSFLLWIEHLSCNQISRHTGRPPWRECAREHTGLTIFPVTRALRNQPASQRVPPPRLPSQATPQSRAGCLPQRSPANPRRSRRSLRPVPQSQRHPIVECGIFRTGGAVASEVQPGRALVGRMSRAKTRCR